jgi:hypothetical protein
MAKSIQWQHLSYAEGDGKVGRAGAVDLQAWSSPDQPATLEYLHLNPDRLLLARVVGRKTCSPDEVETRSFW